MSRRAPAAVGALALTLVLAGCGGSSRPSTDQLASALQKRLGFAASLSPTSVRVTGKMTRCVAVAMEKSRLSDAMLEAIVAGDTTYSPTAQDTKAARGLIPKLAACAPNLKGLESELP